MSNIDKHALRQLATRATPGPWEEENGEVWIMRNGTANSILTSICGDDTSGQQDFDNARFISAANPETALALLDELEAAEKRNGELVHNHRVHAARLIDERGQLKQRIAELEVLAFSPAILDVISERQRQRSVEGWTSEHDDAYQNSELADAAACYAIHAHNQGFSTPAHWPWSPDWWKQSGPRRDLVKAGALILAEIERLDRAAGKGGEHG